MKRRILLYGGLLILLIVVGISTGLMLREYRHQQANHNLIVAIKANHISTALAALKAGADPNTREDALPSRSIAAFIKQLLDRCFHPRLKTDPSDDKPLTALFLHVKVTDAYNPVLVKALLDAGADPNAANDSTISPLWWTVRNGDTQNVRLLLQHGANPRITDIRGCTVLDLASMYLQGESISDKGECISLLLNAGADINARDAYGDTALMGACLDYGDENVEAVRILLQHHADTRFQDGNGKAALDYALERDDTQIIKLLRQAGAKTAKELAMQKVANKQQSSSKN